MNRRNGDRRRLTPLRRILFIAWMLLAFIGGWTVMSIAINHDLLPALIYIYKQW